MGHHQPPTPVVTDSATSDGFVNDNIRQRKSREIDMIFYWVRDRLRQGNYLVSILPRTSYEVINSYEVHFFDSWVTYTRRFIGTAVMTGV